MTMSVRLFARARDLAGASAVSVDLPEGATVGEMRAALAGQMPALAALLPRCAVAVGGEYAADDRGLRAGEEVAVLPPVSGG